MTEIKIVAFLISCNLYYAYFFYTTYFENYDINFEISDI
jgi:hypothetical protein